MTIAPKPEEQERSEASFDRRDFPRVAIDIPTELELQGMGRLPSVSCDLSVGGICVSTRSRFVLDSLRSVTLQLPRQDADAEGRRADGSGKSMEIRPFSPASSSSS